MKNPVEDGDKHYGKLPVESLKDATVLRAHIFVRSWVSCFFRSNIAFSAEICDSLAQT